MISAGGGRAGRRRLEHRLATASHALDLLDRKQRALLAELGRLELLQHRTRQDWTVACADAGRWLRRASALDGRAGLTQAATSGRARLAVDWRGEMGVRFPVATRCRLPEPEPVAGSSALARTATAHAVAIDAAARHAAATRAVQLVQAELDTTRRLHRALDAHVVPALTRALHTIAAQLDEFDREENTRVRWAAGLIGSQARR